jgi:hypothetical protein
MVANCHYNGVMIKSTLRIPEDVYGALKEIAEKEERSINAQIVYILKKFIEDYFNH